MQSAPALFGRADRGVECPLCGSITTAPTEAEPASESDGDTADAAGCPRHAGLGLCAYCFSDSVALCALCAAVHRRAGHTVAALAGSATVTRPRLAALGTTLGAHAQALQARAAAHADRAAAAAERS